MKKVELKVEDIDIAKLLGKVWEGEWKAPRFQREFVWSVADITELIVSVISGRPIGMVTLWELDDNTKLELDPLSLPESDARYLNPGANPSRRHAILDGRQRCTSLAMAFGGLRQTETKGRFAGRFFLDVTAEEPSKQVVYKKDPEIRAKNLNTDSMCFGLGLFPLSTNMVTKRPDGTEDRERFLPQWMRYLQEIRNPANYADGMLPSPEELDRRDRRLKEAFEGINGARLAVYTVGPTYDLATICEIFEKLNTTGTQVSTVDLIHAWVYSETKADPEGVLSVRDWIRDLGELDGAIGWSSISDRPELVAQLVTACCVALDSPPDPRPVGLRSDTRISSVKASDLLSTPTVHWKKIRDNTERFAEYIGDFQKIVANGFFPYRACPYPASAAIYIALRWKRDFDYVQSSWSVDDLNTVYRAFFWRNALARRYDQGFLTQIGEDIKQLKGWLNHRPNFTNRDAWVNETSRLLDDYMKTENPPTTVEIEDYLKEGRPGGALQKALLLPMIAGARRDFVRPDLDMAFHGEGEVQIHHIYPKEWCRKNRHNELKDLLDDKKVDSIANLMPLSRETNNEWKDSHPSTFLEQRGLEFDQCKDHLVPAFIDQEAWNCLRKGADASAIEKFWARRAKAMAENLSSLMTIR